MKKGGFSLRCLVRKLGLTPLNTTKDTPYYTSGPEVIRRLERKLETPGVCKFHMVNWESRGSVREPVEGFLLLYILHTRWEEKGSVLLHYTHTRAHKRMVNTRHDAILSTREQTLFYRKNGQSFVDKNRNSNVPHDGEGLTKDFKSISEKPGIWQQSSHKDTPFSRPYQITQ